LNSNENLKVYSFGNKPYAWLTNKEVTEQIPKGVRLSKPDICPDRIWENVILCWNMDPAERPNFKTLGKNFKEIRDTKTVDEVEVYPVESLQSEVRYNIV
jgi:hypothetical protein